MLVLLALLLAAIKCQQYVTSTMPRVQFFWGFAQQLTQTGKKKHKHIHTIGSVFSGAKFVKGAYLRMLPGGLLVVVLLVVLLLVVGLLLVVLLVVVLLVVVILVVISVVIF